MKKTLALSIAGALAAGVVTTQAAVLLQVNVSDPTAVTITATSAHATLNDNSASTFAGVTLADFFNAPAGLNVFFMTFSTLSPAGTAQTYNWFYNNDLSASDRGLNLYRDLASPQTQIFTTAAPAFTGSATLDLTKLGGVVLPLGLLPTVGTIGNLVVGDGEGAGSGATIGQWQVVVPEPSTWGVVSLVALGSVGVVMRRRNRR
ncbi:MAG: PEP-CTERM sorting domain-containing protein [Verrucomicrobiales bacterium]|nr:PEP-CTERM sorting domain-containing protein [Verrucomicrobiales bacterium]MCP5528113.1 PEP-CTERM sorting domain-containing protein [Verrucomicrobiales bacterium]